MTQEKNLCYTYHNVSLEALNAQMIPIGQALEKGDVVLLYGDLGVGKTTTARTLIQAYLQDTSLEVTSPTFSLLHHYPYPQADLWHFDLYRLKSVTEITELGMEEGLSHGILLIEWPEIAVNLLPKDRLEITLSHDTETTRQLRVKGEGLWVQKLPQLALPLTPC